MIKVCLIMILFMNSDLVNILMINRPIQASQRSAFMITIMAYDQSDYRVFMISFYEQICDQ